MRRSSRRAALLAGFVILLNQHAGLAQSSDGAELFLEVCAPCHSVGEGDLDGPDLISATEWPREELLDAVTRMQEDYTDSLTPQQIDSLVDFLRAPDVQQRIALAESGGEPDPAAPTGSADAGERLFFGDDPLAQGGPPCFACHVLAGRGGTLSTDLTNVATRLGTASLRSITTRPGFPFMKAAYLNRPVTEEEALDLVAFLETPALASEPRSSPARRLHGATGGLVALTMAVLGIVFRSRRGEVRDAMIRNSRRPRT